METSWIPPATMLHDILRRELVGGLVYRRPFLRDFTCEGDCTIHANASSRPSPVFSLRYASRYPKLLAMSDEDGYVSIVNTARELPSYLDDELSPQRPSAQWMAHRNAIFDVAWANNDRWMYTASGDMSVGLWDTSFATKILTLSRHEGSVKSLAVSPTVSEVLATGGRDGALSIWDARTSPCTGHHGDVARTLVDTSPHIHPVLSLANVHPAPSTVQKKRPSRRKTALLGNIRGAVTAVQFLGEGISAGHALASGGADGAVQFWDLRRLEQPVTALQPRTPLAELHDVATANGAGSKGAFLRGATVLGHLTSARCPPLGPRLYAVTSLALRPDASGQLLVSLTGGHHLLYDMTRPEAGPLRWFGGHTVQSFYVKAAFSPDGSHIASGSSDSKVYIWQTEGRPDADGTTTPYVLEGHTAEVTCAAWCPTDFGQLATAADDDTVKVWTLRRQQQDEQPEALQKRMGCVFSKRNEQAHTTPASHLLDNGEHRPDSTVMDVPLVVRSEYDAAMAPGGSFSTPAQPAAAAQHMSRSTVHPAGVEASGSGEGSRMRVSNALRLGMLQGREPAPKRTKQQTLAEALRVANRNGKSRKMSGNEGDCGRVKRPRSASPDGTTPNHDTYVEDTSTRQNENVPQIN